MVKRLFLVQLSLAFVCATMQPLLAVHSVQRLEKSVQVNNVSQATTEPAVTELQSTTNNRLRPSVIFDVLAAITGTAVVASAAYSLPSVLQSALKGQLSPLVNQHLPMAIAGGFSAFTGGKALYDIVYKRDSTRSSSNKYPYLSAGLRMGLMLASLKTMENAVQENNGFIDKINSGEEEDLPPFEDALLVQSKLYTGIYSQSCASTALYRQLKPYVNMNSLLALATYGGLAISALRRLPAVTKLAANGVYFPLINQTLPKLVIGGVGTFFTSKALYDAYYKKASVQTKKRSYFFTGLHASVALASLLFAYDKWISLKTYSSRYMNMPNKNELWFAKAYQEIFPVGAMLFLTVGKMFYATRSAYQYLTAQPEVIETKKV